MSTTDDLEVELAAVKEAIDGATTDDDRADLDDRLDEVEDQLERLREGVS